MSVATRYPSEGMLILCRSTRMLWSSTTTKCHCSRPPRTSVSPTSSRVAFCILNNRSNQYNLLLLRLKDEIAIALDTASVLTLASINGLLPVGLCLDPRAFVSIQGHASVSAWRARLHLRWQRLKKVAPKPLVSRGLASPSQDLCLGRCLDLGPQTLRRFRNPRRRGRAKLKQLKPR